MSIFKDKVLLITGGTGSFGNAVLNRFLRTDIGEIRIFSRDEKKQDDMRHDFQARMPEVANKIKFYIGDVRNKSTLKYAMKEVDYVFHAASNTHPVAYANDPIGTVVTNIIGLNNLLNYAAEHGCIRFLFASSNEIYGENRGDAELFDEKYCGYIDCNTMRAGYPESKRAGEALCQAYIRQKGLDVVIPRFTRSFGPSLLKTDTKALSQFLHKGVTGEDIVLKSAGTQFYSYTYVCDAVSGLLYCLMKGECGEAYNIADVSCDITLRDLAKIIADYVGKQVVFDIPDAVEAAGYSKATKARLDSTKLQGLGWKAQFDMKTGLEHTIDILRAMED